MSGWFSTEQIESVLQTQEDKAIKAAQGTRLERLRSNHETVIDDIVRQYKPELPSVAYSDVTRSKPFEVQEKHKDEAGEETTVIVTGLKVYLPFTGNRKMFFVSGTDAEMTDYPFEPSIGQGDDFITVFMKNENLTSEIVDKHLFAFQQDVEWNLHELRSDIEEWTPDLRRKVKVAIESRRRRLTAISDLDAALAMPVRRIK